MATEPQSACPLSAMKFRSVGTLHIVYTTKYDLVC